MSQTPGSPQFGAVVLTPESIEPSDAKWLTPAQGSLTQTTLDWGPALAAADSRAMASGSNAIIVPPGSFNVGSNQTITSNVQFMPGAQLSISAGITVTFNGNVSAPQTRIFTGSGTATLNGTDQMQWGTWTGSTGLLLASNVSVNGSGLPRTIATYTADGTTATTGAIALPANVTALEIFGLVESSKVANTDSLIVVLNSDTGAHYTQRYILASGGALTTAASPAGAPSSNNAGECAATSASAFSSFTLRLEQPAVAQNHGFYMQSNVSDGTNSQVLETWNEYNQAAAITTVEIKLGANNFVSGSKITFQVRL